MTETTYHLAGDYRAWEVRGHLLWPQWVASAKTPLETVRNAPNDVAWFLIDADGQRKDIREGNYLVLRPDNTLDVYSETEFLQELAPNGSGEELAAAQDRIAYLEAEVKSQVDKRDRHERNAKAWEKQAGDLANENEQLRNHIHRTELDLAELRGYQKRVREFDPDEQHERRLANGPDGPAYRRSRDLMAMSGDVKGQPWYRRG